MKKKSGGTMLTNYLKTAFRHLQKHRFFTFINIIGLAVGLAVSILLFLYVRYELSYDTFHKDYERIYRVISHVKKPGGKTMDVPRTLAELSGKIKQDMPQIEESCKLYQIETTLQKKESLYPNKEMFFTDSTFFNIFSFKVFKGNGEKTLNTPGEVIITKSLAKKYFGHLDVLGKKIERADLEYTVGAVLDDIPSNSHFDFDLLTSFNTLPNKEEFFQRHGFDFFTYFKVSPQSSKADWSPQISTIADNLARAKMRDIGSEGAFEIKVASQPLSKIHLHSNYSFDIDPQGDINNIYIFSFLAAFILIIAIVNFVNLVTAHSEYRSREVGMRKVLGAKRGVVIRQFLTESFIIVLIALIISLFLVELMAGPLGNLLGSELTIDWLNPFMIPGLIGFAIIVGLLSGAYPAFYLSKFDPVRIFSGMTTKKSRNKKLQVGLVVVQFTIAIFLITSLIILRSQTKYLQNKDLGFDKEQVLVVKGVTGKIRNSYHALKNELLDNPAITSVTASVSFPGLARPVQNAHKAEDKASESIIIHENRVQDDYIETYGIEILQGRSFQKDMKTDSNSFIINQAAAKKLGLEDPVGKEIVVFQQRGKIIGVAKNFHFRSFHHKIEPLVFSHYYNYFGNISVRFKTENVGEVKNYVRNTVKKFDEDYYYRYAFVDQVFENLYNQEKQTNRMIMYGSLLAIFIAILGLFALSSFTVVKRTQEIGIRKAMGASFGRIIRLLLYDILKWVLLVNLIAWPAAYYFMSDWLQNFAYRIDMQIWMFLLGGLIALIIAAITISTQTFRAANINPAETLREE